MESPRCPGLFLVGEILDVDGRIGGFNFQWAWCTGGGGGRGAEGGYRRGPDHIRSRPRYQDTPKRGSAEGPSVGVGPHAQNRIDAFLFNGAGPHPRARARGAAPQLAPRGVNALRADAFRSLRERR